MQALSTVYQIIAMLKVCGPLQDLDDAQISALARTQGVVFQREAARPAPRAARAAPLATDGRGRTVAALNTGMAVTRAPAESLIETYLPALLKVQQNLKRIV